MQPIALARARLHFVGEFARGNVVIFFMKQGPASFPVRGTRVKGRMGHFYARSCPKAGSCLPQPLSLNTWQGCGCGLARPTLQLPALVNQKTAHTRYNLVNVVLLEYWAERSQVLSSAGTGST